MCLVDSLFVVEVIGITGEPLEQTTNFSTKRLNRIFKSFNHTCILYLIKSTVWKSGKLLSKIRLVLRPTRIYKFYHVVKAY